jgi:electron transport complex protein RnfD
MRDVLTALVPALIASILVFGYRAALVVAVCVGVCVLSEWLFEKGTKRPSTIGDLSACVTGVLLAFCLPVGIPLWQAAVGSVAAIIVIKQLFGGIGRNFANPAITARIIMFLAFSGAMATWVFPDGVSSATPLAMMSKEFAASGSSAQLPSLTNMLLGFRAGCLGETSAIALLIGGIYLIARRVISWHIPVAFIGTVAIFSLVLGKDVLYQVLSGGLLLGAIFMATDYSTSPMTNAGRLIFGAGCGLITILIRFYGSYPEGVSFGILLMNILVPYIDKGFVRKPFGGVTI